MSSFSHLIPASARRGAAFAAGGLAAVLSPLHAFAADSAQTQIVENPYGLDALWAQGDIVARGTLVALVIMSVATWYVLVSKLLEQSRTLRQARDAAKAFPRTALPHDGVKALAANSPFHHIASLGLEALGRHDEALSGRVDLHTWVSLALQQAIDPVVNRLQGGLSVLATVGSTAPFVGLFGTVWGIYHALTAIGIAGQASIDKVAGPVGEALIMTAIGLAVAVPAVLGYNWLVRRNKAIIESLRGFNGILQAALLASPQSRPGVAAARQSASRAA
jgi:biopolymer transport protein ExbB